MTEAESHSSLYAHRSALQGTPARETTGIVGVRESIPMQSDKTVKRKDEGKHTPDGHYSMLG